MKSKYIIIALLSIVSLAGAQEFNTFYFMPNVAQSALLNPANHDVNRKVIVGIAGLNGFYGSFDHPTNYNEVATEDNLNFMVDGGKISDEFSVPLLFVGLNFDKNHFFFSASEKAPITIYGEGSMFNMFDADFSLGAGQSVAAIVDVSAFEYQEYALGYSRDLLGDRLSVGVTAKALFGHTAFVGKGINFGMQTNNNNENLLISGNGNINASGPFEFTGSTLGDLEFKELDGSDISDYIGFGNTGFAFDLGANFDVTDQIKVSASVVDIGSITWKENNTGFDMTGEFNWTGVDISGALDEDNESDNNLDNLGDSILNSFTVKTKSTEFETALSTKLYIGGSYQLNDKLGFGILNRTIFPEDGEARNSTLLSVNSNFNDVLSLTGTYGFTKDSYDNIGIGVAVRAGFAQFMFGTSNVIHLLALDKAKYTSVKFGINFMFGKIKDKRDIIPDIIDESL